MLILGLIFAGIAAAIHVYIFTMESLRWSAPSTQKTFGIASPAELEATKPLALNQGYYNLFLAVGAAVGIVLAALGMTTVGITLVVATTGVMFLAGVVLLISLPRMARAAFLQMGPPALGIIFLLISASIG